MLRQTSSKRERRRNTVERTLLKAKDRLLHVIAVIVLRAVFLAEGARDAVVGTGVRRVRVAVVVIDTSLTEGVVIVLVHGILV